VSDQFRDNKAACRIGQARRLFGLDICQRAAFCVAVRVAQPVGKHFAVFIVRFGFLEAAAWARCFRFKIINTAFQRVDCAVPGPYKVCDIFHIHAVILQSNRVGTKPVFRGLCAVTLPASCMESVGWGSVVRDPMSVVISVLRNQR